MAKIGRNEPCPCGSGKKYKRCCGRTVRPPERRLMERELRAVGRLVKDREFQSMDELNTFLRESTRHGNIVWDPQTPLEQAQELIYQALEAHNKKQRVRLALRALETSPDCADAYNLLAQESANTLEQARDFYQKGVAAGERALGSEPFTEDVGYFWGILETRPYMRARQGLADCLWNLGEREEAVRHYREMLRLNPNDNQGIRYRLLFCLLEGGDTEACERLLKEYEEEGTATWLYTRALVTFLREGESPAARHALQEALEQNRHVVPYLTGLRRLPREIPEYVGIGDRNEAVGYVAEYGELWTREPGALSWVASVSHGGR